MHFGNRTFFAFFTAFIGLSLIALPVAAQNRAVQDTSAIAVSQVIHLGAFNLVNGVLVPVNSKGGGSTSAAIWDNTGPTGLFPGTPAAQEILDTGDLPDGTFVGSFQIGFATDASSSITMRYAFYENDNFNIRGSFLPTNNGGDAVYDLTFTGLPGGGYSDSPQISFSAQAKTSRSPAPTWTATATPTGVGAIAPLTRAMPPLSGR